LFKPWNFTAILNAALACFPLLAVSASDAPGQTATGEAPRPTAMRAVQSPGGLTARNDREVLEVTVCGDSVVHVVARPVQAPASTAARPWMLEPAQSCPGAAFQFSQTGEAATLTTSRLIVSLPARSGSLSFKTLQGETLLRENGGLARSYIPTQSAGLYRIEDRFSPDATEAIYGHGGTGAEQHRCRHSPAPLQQGLWNPLEHRILQLCGQPLSAGTQF
jgi:hypothetical protein